MHNALVAKQGYCTLALYSSLAGDFPSGSLWAYLIVIVILNGILSVISFDNIRSDILKSDNISSCGRGGRLTSLARFFAKV